MIQYYIQSKSNEAFTLLIDTTKAGTPVGFTIPVASGETYLYDVDWGDGITTANHTGSATHTYAVDGFYKVRITGTFPRIYFNNTGDRLKVIEILNWGQTGFSTDQSAAFSAVGNLIKIPTHSDAWYNSIINGYQMFFFTSLTNLPSNMTLDSLTNGNSMFRGNNLTDLPIGITFPNLTNGINMFSGNSINTTRYSQLLIDMNANNSNNNVPFHGGNSKYNAAGETARNALLARGWTITDGGLQV